MWTRRTTRTRAGHPLPGELRDLGEALDAPLDRPTVLAVTATPSTDMAAAIREWLGIRSIILDPTVRNNLAIEDRRTCSPKDEQILRLAASGGKTVIYVNSRGYLGAACAPATQARAGACMARSICRRGLSRSVRHAVEQAFRTGDAARGGCDQRLSARA